MHFDNHFHERFLLADAGFPDFCRFLIRSRPNAGHPFQRLRAFVHHQQNCPIEAQPAANRHAGQNNPQQPVEPHRRAHRRVDVIQNRKLPQAQQIIEREFLHPLVKSGVFNRHRRMSGKRKQHVDIIVGKAVILAVGMFVERRNRADDAFFPDNRDANHGIGD